MSSNFLDLDGHHYLKQVEKANYEIVVCFFFFKKQKIAQTFVMHVCTIFHLLFKHFH